MMRWERRIAVTAMHTIGVVELTDGHVAAALLSGPCSFALAGPDERMMLGRAYFRFLYGLDYGVQVICRDVPADWVWYERLLAASEEAAHGGLQFEILAAQRDELARILDLGHVGRERRVLWVVTDEQTEGRGRLRREGLDGRIKRVLHRRTRIQSSLLPLELQPPPRPLSGTELAAWIAAGYDPELHSRQTLHAIDLTRASGISGIAFSLADVSAGIESSGPEC